MTTKTKGIVLNPKFAPIMATDKRFVIITGGRGSAKSFAVNTIGPLTTFEQGHKILHTRYTMTSAEISIIPELLEKIDLLGVTNAFTVRRRIITNLVTGSDILFSGIKGSSGDQTARLKSIQGITDWYIEEAEELRDERIFDDINLSIRAKTAQNKIVLILNPTTQDHWIWQRWFENYVRYIRIDGFNIPVSAHPDIEHIHVTYLDNLEHLPPEYVNELTSLKESNPEKYRHLVLGGWLEKAEGVIYENWEEGKFQKQHRRCYGLDPGYFPDPLALIEIAVDKKNKRIYLREKMYDLSLSSESIVSRMNKAVTKKTDLIMCDIDKRLIVDLNKAGFHVRAARKAHKSIVTDIREIQDYRLIVDPTSYNIKRELNNYAWNDRKASIPIDTFNHLMDAMRYAFRKLVPRRRSGIRRRN